MGKYLVVLILLASFSLAVGQTCCSGGVPLSGNLGLPFNESKNELQVSLSYDLNLLTSLKSNTEKLNDNSRERTTQTHLLQLGIPVWNNFSTELLVPYVIQRREISQFNNVNLTQTSGFGDAALLIKYVIINNLSWVVRSGIGFKISTGDSEMTDRGITLNADLQPGSGANDAILWLGINHNLAIRPSMTFNMMGTYRMTGVNDNYLGSFSYEFGNETSLLAGYGDQFLLGKLLVNPSVSFRYRNMLADKQNSFELPNTGGNWLFLRPGIVINALADFSLSLYSEHPLYSEVGGTQLTPTSRYNIGILGTINFRKNEDI